MKTKDMNSGCKLIGLRQVNQIFTLQVETFTGISFRECFADLIFANFFYANPEEWQTFVVNLICIHI